MVAIIVNYFTFRFLTPLIQLLDAEAGIKAIVIVDNGDQMSLEPLLGISSRLKIISGAGNQGYGAAVNMAVKQFPSGWYLVMNPDLLPKKGFSQVLYDAAIQTGALVTGPRFFLDDDENYRLPPATGYSLSLHLRLACAIRKQAEAKLLDLEWAMHHNRFWTNDNPFHEPFLSGACMLIRHDPVFFVDSSIFDERYFMYFEDADLCMRILQSGGISVCVPNARVVHYYNQSPTGMKAHFFSESRDKFLLKHYDGMPVPEISFTPEPCEAGTDLGKCRFSPVFAPGRAYDDAPYFFETGINWFFMPFIQTDFVPQMMRIPQNVWDCLPAGVYYSRIRNELNQTLEIWKWEKV